MADDGRLSALPGATLEAALREVGRELAVPMAAARASGPDPAALARQRIAAAPPRRARPSLGLLRRPVRRGALLAVAAVLAIAAVAGAIGFGLPGLRIVFGPGPTAETPSPTTSASLPIPSGVGGSPSASPGPRSPSPSASTGPGAPGSGLGLGREVGLEEARAAAPFALLVPDDPRFGAPDAAWIDDVGRVTLVWGARRDVPDTLDPGISLIVTALPGHLDRGYFEKLLNAGATIEPVTVGGRPGYWIAGEPHDFVFVGPNGQPVFDTRRMAGDTLAWTTGEVTYRIETSLGRDEALQIAASMR